MRCAPRASCSAFLVLIIDIAKGMFAVWWLPTAVLPAVGIDPALPREWLTLACGFAVIVGHVYPVWFSFRGGKGAATVVGVDRGRWNCACSCPCSLCWFVVLLLTGYVGLATMLAGVALVAAVYVLEPNNVPLLIFCWLVTAFVDLHPSQQHRAHACRTGEPRTTAMAVSIANRLEPSVAAGAAGGWPAALRRMVGESARCEPRGRVERR